MKYSKDSLELLQQMGYNGNDYTMQKMFEGCDFDPKQLRFVRSIPSDEARSKGIFTYNGLKVELHRDIEEGLYVIISRYVHFNVERMKLSYYSDETCDVMHREKGPALFWWNINDKFMEDFEWFKNNKAHRDGDLPQSVAGRARKNSMRLHTITYQKNNQIHRDNGPAYMHFRYSGNNELSYIACVHEGANQSINDNPACITFISSKDRKKLIPRFIYYMKKGNLHRFNGPACITRTNSGKISKKWYVEGKAVDRRVIPCMENGEIIGRLKQNRSALVKATLFDREYGMYLKKVIQKGKDE